MVVVFEDGKRCCIFGRVLGEGSQLRVATMLMMVDDGRPQPLRHTQQQEEVIRVLSVGKGKETKREIIDDDGYLGSGSFVFKCVFE